MKNCETCAHWKRYSTDDLHWDDEAKVNPDDYGCCSAAQHAFWQNGGNAAFYVMDASDYSARLDTRRDFSCNQHQPVAEATDGETQ